MKFTNICPVFISEDVGKTVKYYTETLGFKYADHIDKIDRFVTIYRDEIEIVIVRKIKGRIRSNTKRYGNGFDAYIDTDLLESIDEIYEEFKSKKVSILKKPEFTDYGSYEFAFMDIDNRIIGIGLIADKKLYFEKSDYLK